MDVGPAELGIILVIIMLFFGVGKLPEVGGALGRGIREFRAASREPASDEPVGSAAAPPASQQDESRQQPGESGGTVQLS